MLLRTQHLIIRQPLATDALCYQEIRNSDFVLKYNPMEKIMLSQAQQEIECAQETMYFIELDKVLIGVICLSQDSLRFWHQSTELSFFLKESYANKGYMKEALTAFIPYLFFEKNIALITARAFAENIYSVKLIESLGFCREGYLRKCVMHNNLLYDDIVFSLLKEEF